MVISVLVVDDSRFFRDRITEILNGSGELKVVGQAQDGVEAVEKARRLSPDVITMDYEMPRLNGISAVREIMAHRPTPILMFSSLTYEGARVTLDALAAGALDFLPKNFDVVKLGAAQSNKRLIDRVKALALSGARTRASPVTPSASTPAAGEAEGASTETTARTSAQFSSPSSVQSRTGRAPVVDRPAHQRSAASSQSVSNRANRKQIKLLVIGASTGGPVALQTVLEKLPAKFPVPIALVQHMPSSFTRAFAERLNNYCKISVKEAENGEKLLPGHAFLAPGGKQMMISNGFVKLVAGDNRLQYKPSVDVSFGSAAKSYPGGVLAVVLTGMGFDGREGAKLLKRGGSTIWTQDAESSVIYGMPAAVKNAGLSDEVVSLRMMGKRITDEVMGGSS